LLIYTPKFAENPALSLTPTPMQRSLRMQMAESRTMSRRSGRFIFEPS
jgi:hypothetical protein